jgi:hypothetical protein
MSIMKTESEPYTGNLRTDEISIKELVHKLRSWLNYILSKWVFVLLVTLVGSIAGFLYAYLKKPVYIAKTSFVVESGGGKGGALAGLGGLASMVGIDVGGNNGGIFQGDNILELYRSRKMIESALLTVVKYKGANKMLIEQYIDFNDLKKKWEKDERLKHLSFRSRSFQDSSNSNADLEEIRLQDSVIGIIVKDISENYLNVSKVDEQLNIIVTEVKAKDEFFAKAFNDEIVKKVSSFYLQTITKKSEENVKILQEKTDSVQAVLNGAIYRSSTISDATPNLNPTRQTQRVAPMQRSQVTMETNKLVLGELIKNLELSKISLLKEAPLIQVIDEPIFPLTTIKISKLKAIVIGGFLCGFLAVLLLIIRKFFKMILT